MPMRLVIGPGGGVIAARPDSMYGATVPSARGKRSVGGTAPPSQGFVTLLHGPTSDRQPLTIRTNRPAAPHVRSHLRVANPQGGDQMFRLLSLTLAACLVITSAVLPATPALAQPGKSSLAIPVTGTATPTGQSPVPITGTFSITRFERSATGGVDAVGMLVASLPTGPVVVPQVRTRCRQPIHRPPPSARPRRRRARFSISSSVRSTSISSAW